MTAAAQTGPAADCSGQPAHQASPWSDAALVEWLVRRGAGGPAGTAAPDMAAAEQELLRRAGDARCRAALRRLLSGYALGAGEYLGEDAQAAARHYLGLLSS